MKFNMGCGARKLSGFNNVDAVADCAPDVVFDLEQSPWPWSDHCAEEVQLIHSLEHMGGDPRVFLAMARELYRISAPGCRITVKVPHPRHDNFTSDPTHVPAITPETWILFHRRANDEAISSRRAPRRLTRQQRADPMAGKSRLGGLAISGGAAYVYDSTIRYTRMRTNIEIDDKLMAETLRATGLKTKRQAVELGLRTLLRLRRQEEFRAFRGKLNWTGDLEAMRLEE